MPRAPECPFYGHTKENQLVCLPGGSGAPEWGELRMRFPSRPCLHRYWLRYCCADWEKCPLSAALWEEYERAGCACGKPLPKAKPETVTRISSAAARFARLLEKLPEEDDLPERKAKTSASKTAKAGKKASAAKKKTSTTKKGSTAKKKASTTRKTASAKKKGSTARKGPAAPRNASAAVRTGSAAARQSPPPVCPASLMPQAAAL